MTLHLLTIAWMTATAISLFHPARLSPRYIEDGHEN